MSHPAGTCGWDKGKSTYNTPSLELWFSKVWSPDQQHQYNLGTSWKCQFLGLFQDLLNQKLWVGPNSLCCYDPSWGFWCVIKFEKCKLVRHNQSHKIVRKRFFLPKEIESLVPKDISVVGYLLSGASRIDLNWEHPWKIKKEPFK